MKYLVYFTNQAERDLSEIYEYIAFELCSPEIAKNFIYKIEKRIQGLGFLPERFQLYEGKSWKDLGLRMMKVDNYIVFYTIDKKMAIVTVIRVMYGGRDIYMFLT